MAVDLSFSALFRSGSQYRITNPFDGPDLLNGGIHRAVDVGNFGMNDPILSPIAGKAEGLRHTDSALGIRYHLSLEWVLELWHLNATLAPIGVLQDVVKGQVCGRTGNTGARLPDGSPMPAHTHIVLRRGSTPLDVAPYLLGRPWDTEGSDGMKIKGRFLRHISNRKGKLTSDAHFREGVLTGDDASRGVVPAGTVFYPIVAVQGRAVGTNSEWWGGILYRAGGEELGYFHSSVFGPLEPIEVLEQPGDCSAQDARLEAIRKAGGW